MEACYSELILVLKFRGLRLELKCHSTQMKAPQLGLWAAEVPEAEGEIH